jgi:hypothetical protein
MNDLMVNIIVCGFFNNGEKSAALTYAELFPVSNGIPLPLIAWIATMVCINNAIYLADSLSCYTDPIHPRGLQDGREANSCNEVRMGC